MYRGWKGMPLHVAFLKGPLALFFCESSQQPLHHNLRTLLACPLCQYSERAPLGLTDTLESSGKGYWELCLQPQMVDLRFIAQILLQEKICCLGSWESGQQIASGLTTPSGSPSVIKRHLSQGHTLPRATLHEVGCKDLTNSADCKTMLRGQFSL